MFDIAPHRAAGAPVKVTANLDVGFGIVTVPLSVYAAVEEGTKIRRSQYTEADGHPVGNMAYDKTTGEPYSGPIVKKVTVGSVQVELTDEEIEAVAGDLVKGRAEIEAFIPLDAIGTVYRVVDVKQVRPRQREVSKHKTDDPNAIKVFTLLRAAMADAGVAALVPCVFKTARYGALTPDGELLMLAFADQLRAPRPLPEADLDQRELDMAAALVAALGVDTPVLVDVSGEKLAAYVEAKADGAEVAVAEETPTAPVIDLAAALEQSIAAAQATKVVSPARTARPATPRKRTPAKAPARKAS